MNTNYIYNKFFRNKIFSIDMDFQDLQGLFENLCGEKLVLLDKYVMIYQQIGYIREQLSNLKRMLSRIDEDFKE